MDALKKLRAITHAPLNACKSALEEANDDLDRAQRNLEREMSIESS